VCAPSLLRSRRTLAPQDLIDLPLLQQSTRPLAWQQWFDAAGVTAPLALAGPRYELFSMTAAAAAHGMGIALVPRLLVDAELASGTLVVACPRLLHGERSYYLVLPERAQASQALEHFCHWLQTTAGGEAGLRG